MSDAAPFDVLITGGELVDGSGAPRRRADLAIRGDRIVAIGALAGRAAHHRVDATGRIVAPGFIDAHAHDDAALFEPDRLLPKLSQGVTTVIVGHCGLSLAPDAGPEPPAPLDLLGPCGRFGFDTFGAYLDALDASPPAVNAACLVGLTTLRVRCVAELDRRATARERAAMAAHVDEALAAGAFGVSTGVFYAPARAADAAEIEAACEPMRRRGGVLAAHLRDEADAILPAIDEALDIARALGVPAVLSHHKLLGSRNHGRSAQTLARLHERRRLQPVCQDCYPYAASSTLLDPARAADGTPIRVTVSASHPGQAGRWLADIARDWGVDPVEAARRLLPARAVYFAMHEDDVRRILRDDGTMIGSDGLPYDPVPHPRGWGTFARVLGRGVRGDEEAPPLFGLEQAVHRMTGLTARTWGLPGRGLLAVGGAADVVVFDAARVVDRADFDEPRRPAAGIDRVWVGGRLAFREGAPTGVAAGRALRRRAG